MKKVLFILPFQPLSYFSHLCDQKTDKSHLRDTGFVLGHASEESVLCAGKALLWEPEGAALTGCSHGTHSQEEGKDKF